MKIKKTKKKRLFRKKTTKLSSKNFLFKKKKQTQNYHGP